MFQFFPPDCSNTQEAQASHGESAATRDSKNVHRDAKSMLIENH